jgi:hypothetical protein
VKVNQERWSKKMRENIPGEKHWYTERAESKVGGQHVRAELLEPMMILGPYPIAETV